MRFRTILTLGIAVSSVLHRRRLVQTAYFSVLEQVLRVGDAEWIRLRENLVHRRCLFLG